MGKVRILEGRVLQSLITEGRMSCSCSIVGLSHLSSVSFLHFVNCTTRLDQLDLVLIESNKQGIVHSAFYKTRLVCIYVFES